MRRTRCWENLPTARDPAKRASSENTRRAQKDLRYWWICRRKATPSCSCLWLVVEERREQWCCLSGSPATLLANPPLLCKNCRLGSNSEKDWKPKRRRKRKVKWTYCRYDLVIYSACEDHFKGYPTLFDTSLLRKGGLFLDIWKVFQTRPHEKFVTVCFPRPIPDALLTLSTLKSLLLVL